MVKSCIISCSHQGDYFACSVVAEIYLHLGVKDDPKAEKTAFKWANRISFTNSYPVSYRFLGDMYRLGIGTARNYKKALDLYQKAALHYAADSSLFNISKYFISKEQFEHEKKIIPKLIQAVSSPHLKLPYDEDLSLNYPSPIFLALMITDIH